MLDTETKRRIDTARNILVGKIPDPKSQVEQITIALIYKFMDDMDAEAEEFGGKRSFFAGDFARYGWAKLLRSGLGGHEMLNLYAEAITRMTENPGIPLLFREIFKNAYLPYRDPETLREFLKIIDGFSYEHSENLGDAFEYLLSVLGSQGDAGQFRTPRHIIDFIVSIIDPKKDESILDPACGTSGFLISAYKHILNANTDSQGNSILTPDDKKRLVANIKGYDISPDMVRLSLVNLYLHGFIDPHIYEYDTLTSQDRWNDYAQVILANPPFMTPKGGIKPHNRFSVQAKKSEVLFVDYMAEHLSPTGRAGIIVPEGIIFQSQTAYKQLRKLLVQDYLVAVISLPAGIFQPYSGVKTSILVLDKALARQRDTVAFFKVENDGFGLGAQRRAIEKNDLPTVLAEAKDYLQKLRSGEDVKGLNLSTVLVVKKEKISGSGEYNLSGERYLGSKDLLSKYPTIPIKEIATVESGFGFPVEQQGIIGEEIPFLKVSDMNLPGNEIFITNWNNTISKSTLYKLHAKSFPEGTVIFPKIGAAIATNKKRILTCECTYDNNIMGIVPKPEKLFSSFLYYYLLFFDLSKWASNSQPPSMRKSVVEDHQIPLPPLEIQKEIVAEIEGYQKEIEEFKIKISQKEKKIEAVLARIWGDEAIAEDISLDDLPDENLLYPMQGREAWADQFIPCAIRHMPGHNFNDYLEAASISTDIDFCTKILTPSHAAELKSLADSIQALTDCKPDQRIRKELLQDALQDRGIIITGQGCSVPANIVLANETSLAPLIPYIFEALDIFRDIVQGANASQRIKHLTPQQQASIRQYGGELLQAVAA
jgi:type I restriction enzyme M protein